MGILARSPECSSEIPLSKPPPAVGGSSGGGHSLGSRNTDSFQHPEVTTRGVVVKQEGGILVVTFAAEAFLRARDFVEDQYVAFTGRNMKWSERFARKMATAGFEIHDELGNPVDFDDGMIPMFSRDAELKRRIASVKFLRAADSQPGEYFAMFAQRAIFPRVWFKARFIQEQVCFQVVRTVDEEYRQKGYATDSVGAALEQHEGSQRFLHGTGYELPAYTNTQIRHFDHTQSRPFTSEGPRTEITLRPLSEIPQLHAIAEECGRILHRPINKWGVARNVYDDPYPDANSRDWLNPGIERIRQLMFDEGGLQMEPKDSVRPIYTVR